MWFCPTLKCRVEVGGNREESGLGAAVSPRLRHVIVNRADRDLSAEVTAEEFAEAEKEKELVRSAFGDAFPTARRVPSFHRCRSFLSRGGSEA